MNAQPRFAALLFLPLVLLMSVGSAQVRITHLAPASGAAGALIRIHGVGFAQDVSVEFGGVPARDVRRKGEHFLLAVVPPGVAPGFSNVRVCSGGLLSTPWSFSALIPTVGTPTFIDETSLRLPARIASSRNVISTDIDADGDPDLVDISELPDMLLSNDHAGFFTDETAARLPGTDRAAGDGDFCDVDADGDMDLVIVNRSNQDNQLFLNDGAGHFAEASGNLPPLGDFSRDAACGDLDNDGDIDIVVANNPISSLLINNGTGVFTDEASSRGLVNVPGMCLDIGDIENDGDLDILTAMNTEIRLFVNNGAASFTEEASTRLPAVLGVVIEIAFGDLDGDGRLDILVPNTDGVQNQIWMNHGAGNFADRTSQLLPFDGDADWCIEPGDIDGDGDLDMITGFSTGGYRLYVNDGRGSFVNAFDAFPSLSGWATGLELVDVDGDGHLDLATAEFAGVNNRLLMGRIFEMSHVPEIILRNPQTLVAPGEQVKFTVAAVDPDGDPVTLSAGGLPPGARFDAKNGHFSWNTNQNDLGVFRFQFTASDPDLNTASVTAEILVTQRMHDRNDVGLLITADGRFANSHRLSHYSSFPRKTGDLYLCAGGPWIGGKVQGTAIVAESQFNTEFVPSAIGSTGEPFRVFDSDTPDDQKSWPPEFCTDQGKPVILAGAQNIVVEYNDVQGTPLREVQSPLGVEIRQRSLAYSTKALKNSLIIIWEVTNISSQTISDGYFGFWTDVDVGDAVNDRASVVDNMAITWDEDFAEYWFTEKPAIVGFSFLEIPATATAVGFSSFTNNGAYPDPSSDNLQYDFLQGSRRSEHMLTWDVRTLLSAGPFGLAPGQSVVVAGSLLFGRVLAGTYALGVDPETLRPDPADPVLAELLQTRDEVQDFYDMNIRGTGLPKRGVATEEPRSPLAYTLYQNYPNPFNPETEIRFDQPEAGPVTIVVYDALGQEIRTLVNGFHEAGSHSVRWTGTDRSGHPVASGAYFVRMQAGRHVMTKPMMLLR